MAWKNRQFQYHFSRETFIPNSIHCVNITAILKTWSESQLQQKRWLFIRSKYAQHFDIDTIFRRSPLLFLEPIDLRNGLQLSTQAEHEETKTWRSAKRLRKELIILDPTQRPSDRQKIRNGNVLVAMYYLVDLAGAWPICSVHSLLYLQLPLAVFEHKFVVTDGIKFPSRLLITDSQWKADTKRRP